MTDLVGGRRASFAATVLAMRRTSARLVALAGLCALPDAAAAQVSIHTIEPAAGRARDFYQAAAQLSPTSALELEQRLALLDSALALAQGNDRILYGYHRGSATVLLGRLLDRAMLQQTTCETSRRAAAVWRGAAAAFGDARSVNDDVVSILLEDEIPSSLERAGANERRLCPRSLLNAQRLEDRALTPGRAENYFHAMVALRDTGLAAIRRRVALIDSAVQLSQGYDRAYYSLRRGMETVALAGALNRRANADGTCESARAATAAWRGAAAAWDGARLINPPEVDFNVEQMIPVNLQRAEARERPACDPSLRPPDVTTVFAGARGTIRRLAGEGRRLRPAIHGDRVAWNEAGVHVRTRIASFDNMRLAVHSLAGGVTRIVTRDTASVRDEIALSPTAVAWTSPVPGGFAVFVLRDGEPRPRRVAPGAGQSGPRWSGDDLVYLADVAPAPGRPAVATVMLHQGGRSRPLSRAQDGAAGAPDVSGGVVVWVAAGEGDGRVMVHDIGAGTTRTLSLEPAQRRAAKISGDNIVWVETRGGSNSVMAYDLVTGAVRTLTPPGARPNWAELSGDWVVTVDSRAGGADIFRYDLATGREQRLTAHRPSVGGVAVWGTRVVWWEGDDILLYEEPAVLTPPLQRLRGELERLPGALSQALLPVLDQAAARLGQGERAPAATALRSMSRYLERHAGTTAALAAALEAAAETGGK